MRSSQHQPTAKMITFYEWRTKKHIERVARCLATLAAVTEHTDELIERGKIHDASKFGRQEREPYIWLTEFYRCRRDREPFVYPEGMEQRVRAAIAHHLAINRHHPEYHADPNDMTDVDLIEMVCDWTAMAQEFQQSGGSARGWADKTIGRYVPFNARKTKFIYETIELLDHQLDITRS